MPPPSDGKRLWLGGSVLALTIADAVPEDAGELMTLQRAAFVVEGRRYHDFDLPPLTETLDEVRTAVRTGLVLKALDGTRIVGAVRGEIDGETCRVGRLVVAPDRQGQGIASRLMTELEARMAGRVRRFELFTGARSAGTIRLYRRLGYRALPPRVPDFLIYLEKRLPLDERV
jgi:ribosomal protein S18 acetylase RimI-like enzyme